MTEIESKIIDILDKLLCCRYDMFVNVTTNQINDIRMYAQWLVDICNKYNKEKYY